MTEEIKSIFDQIRIRLHKGWEGIFETAWIRSEVEEGILAIGIYYGTAENEYFFVPCGFDIGGLVYDLWEKYRNAGDEWYEMTYRLSGDGEESISFQKPILGNGAFRNGRRSEEWVVENLGSVVVRYPGGKSKKF